MTGVADAKTVRELTPEGGEDEGGKDQDYKDQGGQGDAAPRTRTSAENGPGTAPAAAAFRRVARRLPKDPGPAAWNRLLGPPPPARRLMGEATADWLVIGAGLTGLAAARRLTQLRPHDRVAVLEATRVGEGPAGRNSGFMIDLPHDLASDDYGGGAERDQAQITQNRAAIAFAAEATAEYGLSREAFDPCGKINAAASDAGVAHNASFAGHLETLGEPYERLDAAAMRAITGVPFYHEGLYTPGAALIQPAMFVRGVADGLANKIALYEESPMTALERRGPDWRAETPAGAVTAPKVILAINGHVESFGFFERRLMHVFTYASMTRALTQAETARLGGEPRWGATPSDPMGATVRRITGTGGARLVIRSRFTFDPSMAVSEARLARVARTHDAGFAKRFPMLEGVEMAFRWGGRLCLSRNSAPAFGRLEDGLFAACCQNGLGAAKGTFAGLSAAEWAADAASDGAAALAAEPEPQRLPPAPLAWLGANAVLRWKEWRARREM